MRLLRYFVILISVIIVATAASAQSYIRLWQKPLDDYRKSAVRLYSYPAPDSINNHAAIIFCPGGSAYLLIGLFPAYPLTGFPPVYLITGGAAHCAPLHF